MRVGEMVSIIDKLLDAPKVQSIMVWGPPGIGKSQIIAEAARKRGWGFKDIRLLLLNPIDLRGIPVANRETGVADWLSAGFLPHEKRDGQNGIMLLDEINACAPSVQAAAYQLVLDRKCGEYTVPDGWHIYAAGNRKSDKGVTQNMPAPLANRFSHFDVEPNLDDWTNWAFKNGIDPSVIGFLQFKPGILYEFPKNASEIRGFPSPRSWEFVSNMVKIDGLTNSELYAICQGTIGDGAAVEFNTWRTTIAYMPDPKAILEGKLKQIPEKQDVKYALSSALVSHLILVEEKDLLRQATNLVAYIKNPALEKMFRVFILRSLCIEDRLKDTLCKVPGIQSEFQELAKVLM